MGEWMGEWASSGGMGGLTEEHIVKEGNGQVNGGRMSRRMKVMNVCLYQYTCAG